MFPVADFEALAAAVEQEDGSVQVILDLEETNASYSLSAAIIGFVLEHVTDAVIGAVLTAAVGWARRLVRRGGLPIEVILYGPKGEVLRRVRVSDPEGDPEEIEP